MGVFHPRPATHSIMDPGLQFQVGVDNEVIRADGDIQLLQVDLFQSTSGSNKGFAGARTRMSTFFVKLTTSTSRY